MVTKQCGWRQWGEHQTTVEESQSVYLQKASNIENKGQGLGKGGGHCIQTTQASGLGFKSHQKLPIIVLWLRKFTEDYITNYILLWSFAASLWPDSETLRSKQFLQSGQNPTLQTFSLSHWHVKRPRLRVCRYCAFLIFLPIRKMCASGSGFLWLTAVASNHSRWLCPGFSGSCGWKRCWSNILTLFHCSLLVPSLSGTETLKECVWGLGRYSILCLLQKMLDVPNLSLPLHTPQSSSSTTNFDTNQAKDIFEIPFELLSSSSPCTFRHSTSFFLWDCSVEYVLQVSKTYTVVLF